MESVINNKKPMRASWQEYLPVHSSSIKNKRALDIGFGLGGDSLLLSDLGYRVVSLDKDVSVISLFKKKVQRSNIQIIKEEIKSYRDKEKFDLILMRHVDHFYTDNDFIEQINKIKDLAKTESIVVLSLINPSQSRIDITNKIFKNWSLENFSIDSTLLSSRQTVTIVEIVQKLTNQISTYNGHKDAQQHSNTY